MAAGQLYQLHTRGRRFEIVCPAPSAFKRVEDAGTPLLAPSESTWYIRVSVPHYHPGWYTVGVWYTSYPRCKVGGRFGFQIIHHPRVVHCRRVKTRGVTAVVTNECCCHIPGVGQELGCEDFTRFACIGTAVVRAVAADAVARTDPAVKASARGGADVVCVVHADKKKQT